MKKATLILCGVFLGVTGCTQKNSPKARYLQAESYWNQKKYSAAIAEFEAVQKEEPDTALGLQSKFRSAQTRYLFLGETEAPLQAFLGIIEKAEKSQLSYQSKKLVGDILFHHQKNYKKVIEFYEPLVKDSAFGDDDRGEFQYRMGRAYLHLGEVSKAVEMLSLVSRNSKRNFVQSRLDLGHLFLSQSESDPQALGKALTSFQEVTRAVQTYEVPYQEAKFGEASVYEEQDQLELALKTFQSLQQTYPNPKALWIRIERLKQRIEKKTK